MVDSMKDILEEIGRGNNADPGLSAHEQMQDEVFRLVLSQLPLRQAVATRLLCPRWKDTWKTIPVFVFDWYNIFGARHVEFLDSDAPMDQKRALIVANTDNFIHDVESVVRAIQQWRKRNGHSEDKPEKLVISYFLNQSHSPFLDQWIQFALEAQPHCLRVHLDGPFHNRYVGFQVPVHHLPYEFPFLMLGRNSCPKELYLSGCSLRPPTAFDGFSNLKLLDLCGTEITNDVLNRLLQNSHLLELLSLRWLPLVTISLTEPLGRLDTLVVKECDNLANIIIQAKSLLQFNYIGPPALFEFKGSPLLTTASIQLYHPVDDPPGLRNYFDNLSSQLPLLRDLVFSVSPTPLVTDGPNMWMFKNLEFLEWDWSFTEIPITHHYLATLLSAAPRLTRLHLTFPDTEIYDLLPDNLELLKKDIPSNTHDNLKEVIVVNFYYRKWLMLLYLYLMKNALGLKSVKLTKGPGIYDNWEGHQMTQIYDVRSFLTEEAPEGVEPEFV